MRVVAIDPGETTGIAVSNGGDLVLFDSIEGQMNAINTIRSNIATDVLVIEEFRISAGTARKTRSGSNTAIEIIGAAKWLAYLQGVPWVQQTPSDVMGFMTNEKLRRIGWYVPNEHARDAVRHLAYYLVKAGHIPAERLLA